MSDLLYFVRDHLDTPTNERVKAGVIFPPLDTAQRDRILGQTPRVAIGFAAFPYDVLFGLGSVPSGRYLRTAASGQLEALTPAQLAAAVGTAGYRCTVGGSANARTITTGLSLASLPTGIRLRARFASANTGATTFNVDGLGAIACRTPRGDALPSGFIRTGIDTVFEYDGTFWVVYRAVERGSNANGEFTRWEDGTMICTIGVLFSNEASNTGTIIARWPYPANFAPGSNARVTGTLYDNRAYDGLGANATKPMVEATTITERRRVGEDSLRDSRFEAAFLAPGGTYDSGTTILAWSAVATGFWY